MAEASRQAWDTASAHAGSVAPRPAHSPWAAGVVGLFLVALVLLLAGAIGGGQGYGSVGSRLALALGFVGPFLWLRLQERAHGKAFEAEMRRLASGTTQQV